MADVIFLREPQTCIPGSGVCLINREGWAELLIRRSKESVNGSKASSGDEKTP